MKNEKEVTDAINMLAVEVCRLGNMLAPVIRFIKDRAIAEPEEENSNDQLLTRREFARKCRVSVRTVDCWISQGKLKPIRFSKRCVRFTQDSVHQLRKQLTR